MIAGVAQELKKTAVGSSIVREIFTSLRDPELWTQAIRTTSEFAHKAAKAVQKGARQVVLIPAKIARATLEEITGLPMPVLLIGGAALAYFILRR